MYILEHEWLHIGTVQVVRIVMFKAGTHILRPFDLSQVGNQHMVPSFKQNIKSYASP